MKDLVRRILREELTPSVKRRIDFSKIDSLLKKHRIGAFQKEEPTELGMAVARTIHKAMYDIMPREFEEYEDDYHKAWDEIKQYLNDNYGEELRQYFEKRRRNVDEDKNPLGIKYIFVKHDKPYYNSGWRGFADGFDSFDEMLTKYGDYVDVDWDEIKNKLDKINDYPEPTFANTMNSRPLRISSIGDDGNTWGYNFSIIKQIPKDNVDKVKDIQTEETHDELDEYSRTLKNARKQGSGLRFPKSAIKSNPLRFRPYNREMVDENDPKVGTGKKPEGSDRRLYTDENPSDTVSVKFRTKQDIVDTLNKESFKSKSHARQSQIINLIHQRLRVSLERAKDPEVKKRLKTAFEYIESKKEQSKKKTQEMKEGVYTKQAEPILNDSGEMYYIDWDENYGKSFKIVHTPEGAQNGVKWDPNMVSVITPENGEAWDVWIELSPKKLLKWKDSWNDIQKSLGVYKYNQIVRNMSNNLQENIHRIKEVMGVINESKFFRRRVDLDKVKKLLITNSQEVFYDTKSYEQFKYELTLRAVEYVMWDEHELGYENLPEQEEIEFVNEVSDIFDHIIKNLYKSHS
jgi:hypothetical protein